MVSPWMICLALFIACISFTQAGEQDRDHLSVGIMIKPENCPRETKDGDVLVVRYNNTLIDQTPVLPTSEFTFTLGEGQVIAGWDMGLRDMCIGELRELVVPPQYGYGEFPVGDKIPPRALLVFYVELLKIKDPEEDGGKPNTFKEIDVDGDGMISHSEVAGYLRREGLSHGEGEESHDAMMQEIFQEEDKNKDGYISHDEFQGLKHGEL
ncbi:PREDICTED: FK506-binding protein 2-like [Acropora digitifera]|uniref:FK506-binding protein 2-like n=1 Tax=Acropora digitifera TaxID=70779 RepID=UPI000779F792|nr:PREDICTED: FK506-binding protein 2-like [Acropora digitifera]XP_015776618.1 PREDICTED: FK506-binding protein 2-like [Acropora digitifera]XP_029206798.2 FK506-binding protein 2-like [Acropora millepora]